MKMVLACALLIILSSNIYSHSPMTHSWYVDDDESLIKTKAQYIGLIDSHSIEVFIDSKPLAIQITEAQREKIESFTPNQQITISYYYNELTTQYILVSIQ